MFAVVAGLDKSGWCAVNLSHDSKADLVSEFKQLLGITATSQEGPWQRARNFSAALTKVSSAASSVARGGVANTTSGTLPAGGVFPSDWLSNNINQKEMYALYHLLRQFSERHPDVLRRAQVLIDVENQSVVRVFNRGRAKNRETHALLVQLFALQVEHGFMLSLNWISTAENGVADAISRPSRDTIIRIAPVAFKALWDEMDTFDINLMACAASVLRSLASGEARPFFSQYDCAGPVGTDVLAQDVSIVPGTTASAIGFRFPPLSWRVTSCNIWRNAKLMLSYSYQMLKRIGSLSCSSPQ